ncbi:hypothetical protein TRIUR3_19231 [Triticum urartu]|uniref:Uncharacterized protein n=1 Tax=Triticum urartu TaxID=4572 RepID=M7ZZ22_TRIUA|nr:hypothetical protein TRIUR3_19231 [Triticum urartu]
MVLLSCSLFFLASFLGSLLFTQDLQGEEDVGRPLRRERLMEAVWPEMAYGESGEPAPSFITYQVRPRPDSLRRIAISFFGDSV